MSQHLLIVEDEPAIRENYQAALQRQGYRVSVASDRPTALELQQQDPADLVVIDVGLGDEVEGGFELCRQLRERQALLPIIFLTARDSEIDEISGFRLGADDYLSKDASLSQLSVRIVRLLQRAKLVAGNMDASSSRIEHGDLSIDEDLMEVRWKNLIVPLTVTEFWMAMLLARRPGHVKSRQQLMQAAELYVEDATITSHIKRIRRKFRQLDPGFDAIESVHGAGYRWCQH